MKNWDDVKYYLAIARSGSVSGAARQLDVSHATALRRIDQLEKDMGVKLFKRLQSGYQLSAAGEALYDSAVAIESEVQKMYSGAYEDQLAGPLRVTQPQVGFVDTYGIYAAFIRRHPEINLEILPSYWEVNLNKQEADVAILAGEHPHELLVGRQLGSVRWHIYASKNYLAGFDEPPTPVDLDWVMLQRELLNIAGAGVVNLWDLLLEAVAKPKVVMQSRSYSDVIFAVQEGLGASFMSDAFAHKYPDLVRVAGCDMYTQTKLWLLTHRDLRNMARVRCFMQFVGERLTQQLMDHSSDAIDSFDIYGARRSCNH